MVTLLEGFGLRKELNAPDLRAMALGCLRRLRFHMHRQACGSDRLGFLRARYKPFPCICG